MSAGVVAIVRLRACTAPVELYDALVEGGVTRLEVTLPTPDAETTIEAWTKRNGGVSVGAGTVRTAADVARATRAGAQFLVTPTFRLDVLDAAHAAHVPVYCGAATATECDMAWSHPAVVAVKVFPAATLGGPAYIKALKDPLDDVKFLPTGGVDPAAARAYAALGCVGVGVGGALVSESLVRDENWEKLRRRATDFCAAWVEGEQRA